MAGNSLLVGAPEAQTTVMWSWGKGALERTERVDVGASCWKSSPVQLGFPALRRG